MGGIAHEIEQSDQITEAGECVGSGIISRTCGAFPLPPNRLRCTAMKGRSMPPAQPLKRRAYLVDERAVREARKALGATSDDEAVRISVARIAEMERFWRLMRDTRRSVAPGGFDKL